MIIGIGSDIIEVSRMKKELSESTNGARDEIFTEHEISYCSGKRYPERHYAARFAAKEAVFKALAVGKTQEFRWHNIEIRNDANGKPYLIFYGTVQAMIDHLAIRNVVISLTHTAELAMATVVLEN